MYDIDELIDEAVEDLVRNVNGIVRKRRLDGNQKTYFYLECDNTLCYERIMGDTLNDVVEQIQERRWGLTRSGVYCREHIIEAIEGDRND